MFSREVAALKDLQEQSEVPGQSSELQQLPSKSDEIEMSIPVIKAEC